MSEIIAVEKSTGGINRYCHYCDVNCKQTLYSICLHTIGYIERGGTSNWGRCEQAIRAKVCPAQAMRQKELEAGQALFFSKWVVVEDMPAEVTPRELPRIDRTSDSYKRGWNYSAPNQRPLSAAPERSEKTAPSVVTTTATKPVKKEAGAELLTMDYGKLVETETGEPKTEPKDTGPLPGETTLAYMKRVRGNIKN